MPLMEICTVLALFTASEITANSPTFGAKQASVLPLKAMMRVILPFRIPIFFKTALAGALTESVKSFTSTAPVSDHHLVRKSDRTRVWHKNVSVI
jgi:hypothetical protein